MLGGQLLRWPRPEAAPELRPGRLDGALEAANTGGFDVTDVTDVTDVPYASGHLDKFEAGGLPERLVRPQTCGLAAFLSLPLC